MIHPDQFLEPTKTQKECTCIEVHGFIHKCPLHKEGPPTLRECRDILRAHANRIASLQYYGLAHQLHKDLAGLTDEALERDEKRTAALEAENKKYRKCLERLLRWSRTTGNENGFVAVLTFDALTPAPQKDEV